MLVVRRHLAPEIEERLRQGGDRDLDADQPALLDDVQVVRLARWASSRRPARRAPSRPARAGTACRRPRSRAKPTSAASDANNAIVFTTTPVCRRSRSDEARYSSPRASSPNAERPSTVNGFVSERVAAAREPCCLDLAHAVVAEEVPALRRWNRAPAVDEAADHRAVRRDSAGRCTGTRDARPRSAPGSTCTATCPRSTRQP